VPGGATIGGETFGWNGGVDRSGVGPWGSFGGWRYEPGTATALETPAPWPLFPVRETEDVGVFLKRVVDVLLALPLLLLALPLLAVAALLVRWTSSGPVFFLHTRKGRGEDDFAVIKLRTMVQGAESRIDDVSGERSGPLFSTVRDDPRVTRIGRILRRYSIDELPQLINVLRGEMSLVGPRPLVDGEVRRLPPRHRWARAGVRPGMTGLWQVSGRNDCPDEARLTLDRSYLDEWSLGLDLEILLRTIPAVLTGRGAN